MGCAKVIKNKLAGGELTANPGWPDSVFRDDLVFEEGKEAACNICVIG